MDILIPNLGDIESVEVTEICVTAGQHVTADDALIVIESDKASMEVPAGTEGVIEKILVGLGDVLENGAVIAHIASASASGVTAEQPSEPTSATPPAQDKPSQVAASDPVSIEVLVPDLGDIEQVEVIEIAVAVGDRLDLGDLLVVLESDKASMEVPSEVLGDVVEVGVKVGDQVRSGALLAVVSTTSQPDGITNPSVAQQTRQPSATPAPSTQRHEDSQAVKPRDETASAEAYAGPAARLLARELGVSLDGVQGRGRGGRITKEDIKRHVKLQRTTASGGLPALPKVDHASFGEVKVEDLSRIQVQVAKNMHRNWVNIPHVTQHDLADVDDLERFRSSLKAEAARRGLGLSPLPFIIKAVTAALLDMPKFNSSLEEGGTALVYKRYLNIGVAVDTPEGLVVPVIPDADKMGVWELAAAVVDVAERAKKKKLGLDEMRGGTFTVSSLGRLGGTGFSPIINAPEVAILGVGRTQIRPVWQGDAFVPRQHLPLSLSYDHRVINGVDGGNFMQLMVKLLGDIRHLSL